MAGTPKNYERLDTISGPVDIWFEMTVPAAGAAPSLFTDGTPDATANANVARKRFRDAPAAPIAAMLRRPRTAGDGKEHGLAPHFLPILARTPEIVSEFTVTPRGVGQAIAQAIGVDAGQDCFDFVEPERGFGAPDDPLAFV